MSEDHKLTIGKYIDPIIIFFITLMLLVVSTYILQPHGQFYVVKSIFLIVAVMIMVLGTRVKQTGNIYWMFRYDYEEALAMKKKRRRAIGKRLANACYISMVSFLIYLTISYILRFTFVIDIVFFFLAMILLMLLDGTN